MRTVRCAWPLLAYVHLHDKYMHGTPHCRRSPRTSRRGLCIALLGMSVPPALRSVPRVVLRGGTGRCAERRAGHVLRTTAWVCSTRARPTRAQQRWRVDSKPSGGADAPQTGPRFRRAESRAARPQKYLCAHAHVPVVGLLMETICFLLQGSRLRGSITLVHGGIFISHGRPMGAPR